MKKYLIMLTCCFSYLFSMDIEAPSQNPTTIKQKLIQANELSQSTNIAEVKQALALFNEVEADPKASEIEKEYGFIGTTTIDLLHPFMMLNDLMHIMNNSSLPEDLRERAEYLLALKYLQFTNYDQAEKHLRTLVRNSLSMKDEALNMLELLIEYQGNGKSPKFITPQIHYESVVNEDGNAQPTKAEAIIELALLNYHTNNPHKALSLLSTLLNDPLVPFEIKQDAADLKEQIVSEYPHIFYQIKPVYEELKTDLSTKVHPANPENPLIKLDQTHNPIPKGLFSQRKNIGAVRSMASVKE